MLEEEKSSAKSDNTPDILSNVLDKLGELYSKEPKDIVREPKHRVHIEERGTDTLRAYLIDRMEAETESFRQDTRERKVYAGKAFVMVSIYLIVVALFFFLAGLECAPFHCSDAVLITLLSTTTTTVIGIFLLVMQYLFHKK